MTSFEVPLKSLTLNAEELEKLQRIRKRMRRSPSPPPPNPPKRFKTAIVDSTLLIKYIDEGIERCGSAAAFARSINVCESSLSKVRAGSYAPSDRILRALGLRQCISYVRR